MKKNLWILFIVLFFVYGVVGYSFVCVDLSISGNAIMRKTADFRITDLSVSTFNDGESINMSYSAFTSTFKFNLLSSSSYIEYKITLDNNSSNCLSVSSIDVLENTNKDIYYEISYLEFDKAYCDEKISFYITVKSKSEVDGVLKLKFNFQEMKPYILTNILENPSFETGEYSPWRSWMGTSNLYVSDDVALFGEYSAKNDHSVQWDTVSQYYDSIPGHKYYGISYMYPMTTNGCYSQMGFYYNNTWNWSLGRWALELNSWTRVSHYVTAPTDAYSNSAFITADYNKSDGEILCYTDGNVIVDLTNDFGVGNEPSIEWCDSHIDFFEGTMTIYK